MEEEYRREKVLDSARSDTVINKRIEQLLSYTINTPIFAGA